jgi:hypothetical protein
VISRRAVGDSSSLDLPLGTHEALGHRRLDDEERACDLLGRQAAKEPQRQRNLRILGQRRVTAGEDQPKPVVVHGSVLLGYAAMVGTARQQRQLPEQLSPAQLAA